MRTSIILPVAGVMLWIISITGGTVSTAAANGTISGAVADLKSGAGLPGIAIHFLDAVNAVIHGTATTDGKGSYQSSLLPSGYYRVRFGEAVIGGSYYRAAYYGATGEDLWELASIVQVTNGSNVIVNAAQEASDPSVVVTCAAMITGRVTDASGAPLGGIQVSARNALNAMPIEIAGVQVTAATDSDGKYDLRTGGPCVSDKIRFADPTGNFLSEYSGAGGADDFSLAVALTRSGFDEKPRELNETLARVPPDQAIQNVIDLVVDLGFFSDTNLTGGLDQGIAIVQDENPNNDSAACGILDAFINRVNNQLKKGELTQPEATALVQNATAAKSAIGCR